MLFLNKLKFNSVFRFKMYVKIDNILKIHFSILKLFSEKCFSVFLSKILCYRLVWKKFKLLNQELSWWNTVIIQSSLLEQLKPSLSVLT